MVVTEDGQVALPKRIRETAGVHPGTEVSFGVEGRSIVITPIATRVRDDRWARLRTAAARVRESFGPAFRQLGARELMDFLRGDGPAAASPPR